MTKHALFIATALATALCAATPAWAEDAAKPMTRAEIEAIVHEYIMNNAPVIMDSVDQYQRKSIKERSETAIKSNFETLYNDRAAPFIGNPEGDVVMVEFFDYNCGYCKKVMPELLELIEKDKGLKIIFKDIPILGPSSEVAAKWALAAHGKGKYIEFHTALMKHSGKLDEAELSKIATDVGLNADEIKRDSEKTDVMIQLEKNRALATQVGVTGTPAFVVGDELFPGAMKGDDMYDMIQEKRKALKK